MTIKKRMVLRTHICAVARKVCDFDDRVVAFSAIPLYNAMLIALIEEGTVEQIGRLYIVHDVLIFIPGKTKSFMSVLLFRPNRHFG